MHSFYEPVSYAAHAHVRWSPPATFEFARKMKFVPMTLLELRRAVHHFPLCLRRIGETIDVVAILADHEGCNIHLNAIGNWTAGYTPFALRAHPFSLVRNARDRTPRLALTRDDDVVGDHGQYPLFESSGRLSGPATAVYEELLAAEKSQETMKSVCRILMQIGIAIQVPPQAIGGGNLRHRLFVVDQDRLDDIWNQQRDACVELYEKEPFALHVAEALVFSQRAFVMRARQPELVEGDATPFLVAEDSQATAPSEKVESYIDYDSNIAF